MNVPQKINQSEFDKKVVEVRGRKNHFDYEKLFNGDPWKLTPSDFECVKKARSTISGAAYRKGYTIKSAIVDGNLFIQATPKQG